MCYNFEKAFDGNYNSRKFPGEFRTQATPETMKNTAINKIRLAIFTLLILIATMSQSKGQGQYVAYNPAQAQQIYAQEMAAYQYKMAVYQQQMAAYQQQKAAYDQAMARQAAYSRPAPAYSQPAPAARTTGINFNGRFASAPGTPAQVQYVVDAANRIQSHPYRRGGGHARVDDSAYDCSGSVSHCLIKAGLLRAPLPSTGFASYGLPGPGRFITIFVKPGEHVFMTVCGLRMDTGGGRQEEGPRWRAKPRSTAGFSMRHPAGF